MLLRLLVRALSVPTLPNQLTRDIRLLLCVQCASLQKELDSIQQQLQRVDHLLHIADPEGWYKPKDSSTNAAAAAAKAAAKAALEEERQRRAAAVAAQRAQQAAQVSIRTTGRVQEHSTCSWGRYSSMHVLVLPSQHAQQHKYRVWLVQFGLASALTRQHATPASERSAADLHSAAGAVVAGAEAGVCALMLTPNCLAVSAVQAEPFEPEVEEADDRQQQQEQQQSDGQPSSAAAIAAAPAAVKPVPVVIRPKGLIPGAKPQPGKPAAATAAAAKPTAGGSSGSAAAEKAAALMKEFAQPAAAAGNTAKKVVKVGDLCCECAGGCDPRLAEVTTRAVLHTWWTNSTRTLATPAARNCCDGPLGHFVLSGPCQVL